MWIAHLSDPHVRPEGVLYQGVLDTNAAFAAAIRQVNALDPQPDVVVLTGDIVDEGDPAEYAVARRLLAELRAPLIILPGNHDDRENFRAAFGPHRPYLPPDGPLNFVVGDAGPVRLVALDVTVPGLHHGEVPAASLAWLEATLDADPDRPTAVLMHHPPVWTDVPFLDEYRLHDPKALERVVARFPAIERVLCGHVHRVMQMRFGGTLMCTAPSTATAVALRPRPDAEPASYLEPPGFLLHQWRDGRMLTHLVPIGDFPGPFPFA